MRVPTLPAAPGLPRARVSRGFRQSFKKPQLPALRRNVPGPGSHDHLLTFDLDTDVPKTPVLRRIARLVAQQIIGSLLLNARPPANIPANSCGGCSPSMNSAAARHAKGRVSADRLSRRIAVTVGVIASPATGLLRGVPATAVERWELVDVPDVDRGDATPRRIRDTIVSRCGFPSSLTSKSSAVRSVTDCPCRSSTATSRRTAGDVLRRTWGAV